MTAPPIASVRTSTSTAASPAASETSRTTTATRCCGCSVSAAATRTTAANAMNRLGMGFDVQGGGSDLIVPHHENSAAHAEALSGTHPFARHYVHAGMIGLDGEKMSKSRGNLVLVSKLRNAGIDPMAVRLALLDGH